MMSGGSITCNVCRVVHPLSIIMALVPGSLVRAADIVKAGLDEGTTCPCCDQFAKRYRRPLNSGAARWLISLVLLCEGHAWAHTSDVIKGLTGVLSGTDATTLLPHWDLIEAKPNDDSKKRTSGFWRPTDKGVDFVLGRITVQKTVVRYNNVREGFEGDEITIQDALGDKFNYSELMGR